jgi:LmbE family N-acetylglucosaminyl deacetylase
MTLQNLDLGSLTGTILILAPHMDDEALACGGLIARLPDKERIHLVYATDGMRSPAPIIPGRDEISPDLGAVRRQESAEAMKLLGVPEQNLYFLCLPEAELKKNLVALRESLREKIKSIRPDIIFMPFRYDRHPDHLAINHVIAADFEQGLIKARLVEYFVYYRWRLMPKRDIRKYVRPPFLYQLDISDVAQKKRSALDRFTSQTTIYYPWQTRPILTPTLLDEECRNPEYFLLPGVSVSGTAVLSGPMLWIRLAHRLEPFLQRWKYQIGAFLKRMLQNRER